MLLEQVLVKPEERTLLILQAILQVHRIITLLLLSHIRREHLQQILLAEVPVQVTIQPIQVPILQTALQEAILPQVIEPVQPVITAVLVQQLAQVDRARHRLQEDKYESLTRFFCNHWFYTRHVFAK